MQEPIKNTEDIFSETNEDEITVRRLHSLSRFLFAVAILSSVLSAYLFLPYLEELKFLAGEQPGSKFLLQGIASAVYTFGFAILFPIQVYFFWRYAQTSRKTFSEQGHSKSVMAQRFLLKNAWLSCITFTLNLLYLLFVLATETWVK